MHHYITNIIGKITLNISFLIYLVYFLPQLIHNQKQEGTNQISLMLQLIYFISTCADLCYGFGRNMPWEYKLVSITTYCALITQHWQLRTTYTLKKTSKMQYYALTILSVIVLSIALQQILHLSTWSKETYIICGTISNIGYIIAWLPQILKNHTLKSTTGLSIIFIYLCSSCALLDLISALSLSWDWPSIIGPILIIAATATVIWQKYYFNKISYARKTNYLN